MHNDKNTPLTNFVRGCRCEVCVAAWSIACTATRKRKLHNLKMNPTSPSHGLLSAYKAGCRCEACRKTGNADSRARWKAKKMRDEVVICMDCGDIAEDGNPYCEECRDNNNAE